MLRVWFLVSFLLLVTSASAWANLPSDCTVPSVRSIDVPLFRGESGSPNIELRYELLEGENPTAPVLIYIPGGPGGASIGWSRMFLHAPPANAVVFTAPRGTSCSPVSDALTTGRSAADYLRSEFAAQDIVELALSLNRPFVFWGHSYGTVLATIAASRVPRASLHLLKGVVLEGTLGRVFRGTEMVTDSIRLWRRRQSELTDEARAELLRDRPYGLDPVALGTYIQQNLGSGPLGRYWDGAQMYNLTDPFFLNLNAMVSEPQDSRARQVFTANAQESLTLASSVPSWIRDLICAELSEIQWPVQYRIESGHLVNQRVSVCPRGVRRYYNSARYQVPAAAPILYIQGTHDAQTPLRQARRHFFGQQNPNKMMLVVSRGGHNPTRTIETCMADIWRSFLSGGSDLETVTQACLFRVRVIRP